MCENEEYTKMFENFNYIKSMPFVKDLIKENLKLKEKNNELKNLLKLIGRNLNILENVKKSKNKNKNVLKRRNNSEFIKIKEENDNQKYKFLNIVENDTAYKSDNIIISINDDDNNNNEKTEIKEKLKNDNVLIIEQYNDCIQETEQYIVEEEDDDDTEEIEESEETYEVETKETEKTDETKETEETEETDETEETEETEETDEEVYEVKIEGKIYYTTNIKNGIIYDVDKNGDVGDEVGYYKNGNYYFMKN